MNMLLVGAPYKNFSGNSSWQCGDAVTTFMKVLNGTDGGVPQTPRTL